MLVSAARFLEALTAPLWFGCCVSHHSGQLSTTHRTNFGPTSSWLGHGKDSLHSFHPVGSVFRCPVRRTPSFRRHRASLRRAGQGWIGSWCCTTCVGCTVRATVGEHEATHGPAASLDRGAHCCGASSTPVPVISSSWCTVRTPCDACASCCARAPTCCDVDLERTNWRLSRRDRTQTSPIGGSGSRPHPRGKRVPFRGGRRQGRRPRKSAWTDGAARNGERRLDPVDATWEKDTDHARGKRRIGTSTVPSPSVRRWVRGRHLPTVPFLFIRRNIAPFLPS